MVRSLHEIVGDSINDDEFPKCKVIKDRACGGQQNVPLFCSENKSNKTEYCNVDLLMIEDNKIQVIIEIEASDVSPIRICGKLLTSALASYYIHHSENNTPIGMGDSVLFIQVLDTSNLPEKTSKIEQWKNLEKSIGCILPIGKITKYMIYGNALDLEDREGNKCAKLISYIKEELKPEA